MEDYVQFLFLEGEGWEEEIYEHTLKKQTSKKKTAGSKIYIRIYIYICLELYIFYISSMLFIIFPIRI